MKSIRFGYPICVNLKKIQISVNSSKEEINKIISETLLKVWIELKLSIDLNIKIQRILF